MIFLPSQQQFMVGENKDLAINVWDQLTGGTTDLSAATATIALYKNDDTSEVAAGAATLSTASPADVYHPTVYRTVDSTSWSVGMHRAVALVTFGGKTQGFQWSVEVLPKPAGQMG